MGKILQYLGVSEEGQSRDILDAERLLEGMQMIYSQAPEGNKKDSFSVPLAEMTKIFIEKIKGIEPTPIPEPEVKEEEELPFKEGDRFIEKASPNIIFTITKIEDERIDLEWVTKNGNIGEMQNANTLYEAKSNFESGEWVLIKDEEFPYKINDKFKVQDTIEKFAITNINEDTVEIAFVIGDGTIDLYNLTKEEFLENVSLGRYIKITDEEFSPKPQKPKRTRKPKKETEQEKQIREILEINLDDIDL